MDWPTRTLIPTTPHVHLMPRICSRFYLYPWIVIEHCKITINEFRARRVTLHVTSSVTVQSVLAASVLGALPKRPPLEESLHPPTSGDRY
jgi:hypothetical protein